MIKILVIGPNPKDPSRKGGVVVCMQRLMQLNLNDISMKPLYTDIVFFSKLNLIKLGRLLSIFKLCFQLLSSFIKKVDIVHIHVSLTNMGVFRVLPIFIVSKMLRYKVIIQVHGGRIEHVVSKTALWFWLYILRRADSIFCFKGEQYQELLNFSKNKNIRGVKNFINKLPFNCNLPLPTNNVMNFIYIGRLENEKGINELIASIDILNENNTYKDKYNFNFVGDGSLKQKVKTHALKHGNIRVHGFLSGDKLDAVIKDCDVLVLPSYHEGFPLVFIEVSYYGLASIITSRSSLEYYFDVDKEFLSVEPGESSKLVDLLIFCIENPVLIEQIKKAVKVNVVNNYLSTSINLLDEYETFFKEVIK